MTNIRIKFHKLGNAKYISHLDLNRCFQKAFKRSGLPIWWTEGFNPHIYLNFLLPLSLGFESKCELLDFRVTDDVSLDEIKSKLNEAFPKDFYVEDVWEVQTKPTDIAFCEYVLEFNGVSKTEIEDFVSLSEINVIKRTKRSESEINLKEYIKSCEIVSIDGGAVVTLVLPGGSMGSVNPELFQVALEKHLNKEVYAKYLRTKVLKADLTEFR